MRAGTLFFQVAIENLAKRRACNFAETRSSLAEKPPGSDSIRVLKNERFLPETRVGTKRLRSANFGEKRSPAGRGEASHDLAAPRGLIAGL
jgi:hypothetical protein